MARFLQIDNTLYNINAIKKIDGSGMTLSKVKQNTCTITFVDGSTLDVSVSMAQLYNFIAEAWKSPVAPVVR